MLSRNVSTCNEKNMSDAKPNRKTKKSENLIGVERLVKSLVFEKRTGRLKHNKV